MSMDSYNPKPPLNWLLYAGMLALIICDNEDRHLPSEVAFAKWVRKRSVQDGLARIMEKVAKGER